MNYTDIQRFDRLHHQKDRTPLEEAEYRVLLERVVLGKDGKSEFDTAADSTGIFAQQARELARKEMAKRLVDGVLKYGAEMAIQVLLGLGAALTKK